MKAKLLTIAMMAALMLAVTNMGKAQDVPCLPQEHGLDEHQSAVCGVTQTIELAAGWNWVSIYIDVEGNNIFNQLKAGLGTSGLQITSQGKGGSIYRNGTWVGTVTILNESGYKIRTSAPVTFEIGGSIVDPEECPISINPGWNWIGYPVTAPQAVGTALAGFTPTNGDQIKTQGGGATYRNGIWMPATFTFEPGKSYAYKSTSSQSKTLVFQTGAKARRAYPNFGKSKEQLKEVNPTH